MPEVRALKSFKGRYGQIRSGQTFNCDPGYLTALLKNKLVEVIGAGEPGPSKNRNLPEAPQRSGKDAPGQGSTPTPSAPQPPAAGLATTSLSLPVDPALLLTTSPKSERGARRGNPTARKVNKTKPSSTPPAGAAV